MTKTSKAIREKVQPALDEWRRDLERDAALRQWAKEVAKELASGDTERGRRRPK